MLKNFVAETIRSRFEHEPTDGQNQLISKLSDFIQSNNPDDLFLLRGYAGTGKTSVMSALVQVLNMFKIKSILLAPTGRAAKVLSHYSGESALTIHRKIYRQKSLADGFGAFALNKNLHNYTIFIVDEASMISNENGENSVFGSGRLLDDLIEFVYTGNMCKLILIGDTAQLPPVKTNLSPALDTHELSGYGLNVIDVMLSDVVRQGLDSGILFNATHLRNVISEWNGNIKYPELTTAKFPDIRFLSGVDLIDEITTCYDTDGLNETKIITRSNKRANIYNQGIRNKILWREDEIAAGDQLMVVRNNYFWLKEYENIEFIANGDIVEINRIIGFTERYGLRFADVELVLPDYKVDVIEAKIVLDTLHTEGPALSQDENRKFFESVSEDYADIPDRRQRYAKMEENPFFNALQVKFAYAVTCHKAQGGQWKNVFLDHGYFVEDMMQIDFLRWLYTGFTRAIDKLYLVNFDKKMRAIEEQD